MKLAIKPILIEQLHNARKVILKTRIVEIEAVEDSIGLVDRAKMNHTTVNTTLQSCGFEILPLNPAKISRDLHAVLIFIIAVNALTCPFVILLNILVMVAVKTK